MAECFQANDVYVSVFIEENNIFDGASKVLSKIRPEWSSVKITYKLFTDGITNKLVGCFYDVENNSDNDIVLVRIYGNKTDLLVDRKAELRNIRLLHNVGLAPELYAVFDNGLAYQYVPGVTLSPDSVLDSKVWPLVAQRMAQMHKVQQHEQIPKEPMLWSKIEQFLNLLPETFCDPIEQKRFENHCGSVAKLRTEFNNLKRILSNIVSPVVFAHNDLLLGNVIYNEKESSVTFIDFEYAAYNYQAFDIANHFSEFVGISDIDYKKYPSKEFQMQWLSQYLGTYSNELQSESSPCRVRELQRQVDAFVPAAHFLWGVWALVQAEYSHIEFDFIDFAIVRLTEYYKRKYEC